MSDSSYSCPVCKATDADAYLRCNRPDCPDGRDQPLITVPPLRIFEVKEIDPHNPGYFSMHVIEAHFAFDNSDRGEGLVLRRYAKNSVLTDRVAEFQPGYWAYYKDITNVKTSSEED